MVSQILANQTFAHTGNQACQASRFHTKHVITYFADSVACCASYGWLSRKSPQLKDKPSSEILFQISSEWNDGKSDPRQPSIRTHRQSSLPSRPCRTKHVITYFTDGATGCVSYGWLSRKSPQLKDKPSSEILFQISSEWNDCKSNPRQPNIRTHTQAI